MILSDSVDSGSRGDPDTSQLLLFVNKKPGTIPDSSADLMDEDKAGFWDTNTEWFLSTQAVEHGQLNIQTDSQTSGMKNAMTSCRAYSENKAPCKHGWMLSYFLRSYFSQYWYK